MKIKRKLLILEGCSNEQAGSKGFSVLDRFDRYLDRIAAYAGCEGECCSTVIFLLTTWPVGDLALNVVQPLI